jgi:methylated-DNA-[protein]-cysteine S-methyltransferase
MKTAAVATRPRSTTASHASGVGTSALGVDTPVGRLMLEASDEGLTHLTLPNKAVGRKREGSRASWGHIENAATQLDEYFGGTRSTFDLALVPSGTAFQRDVWFALADIPYGETISYAELAQWVGKPRAFRAVGQANGANPLAIVLPCHRVVASGGGIGGYGGGLDLKRWLLAHEGAANPT